jgi:hypothetical protein
MYCEVDEEWSCDWWMNGGGGDGRGKQRSHLLRQRSLVIVSLRVNETRGSTAMSCTEASIGEMKKYRLPAATEKNVCV